MKPRSKSEWILPAACGRFRSFFDRPRAAFLLAVRQETDEAQQAVARLDEVVEARRLNAHLREELFLLLGRVVRDVLLRLGADGDALRALGLGQPAHGLVVGVRLHAVHQVVLAHVRGVDDGLRRQQAHLAHERGLIVVLGVELERAGVLARAEVLSQLFHPRGGRGGLLVARLAGLLEFRQTVFHHFKVAQDELGVDGLDVAHRVDAALDVDDVRAVKAAHDVHDGVALADVSEELVAQALALRRALHKARDVHEFHDGRGFLVRVPDLGQLVEARVRDRNNADVRLDGAERIVRGACAPRS